MTHLAHATARLLLAVLVALAASGCADAVLRVGVGDDGLLDIELCLWLPEGREPPDTLARAAAQATLLTPAVRVGDASASRWSWCVRSEGVPAAEWDAVRHDLTPGMTRYAAFRSEAAGDGWAYVHELPPFAGPDGVDTTALRASLGAQPGDPLGSFRIVITMPPDGGPYDALLGDEPIAPGEDGASFETQVDLTSTVPVAISVRPAADGSGALGLVAAVALIAAAGGALLWVVLRRRR